MSSRNNILNTSVDKGVQIINNGEDTTPNQQSATVINVVEDTGISPLISNTLSQRFKPAFEIEKDAVLIEQP